MSGGSRRAPWAPAGIAAAALLLRLWRLEEQGLYIDEYFEYFAAAKPAGWGALLEILRDNPLHALVGPAINFLLAGLADGPQGMRVFNAALGAATVAPMFLLGERLGGRRLGLVGAALLAGSMLHVEWSRRLPFYPLMVWWTLLSTLSLLRAIERGSRSAWAAYAAAQAVFSYTHPYAFPALALQGAWVAWARRESRAAWAAAAAAALLAYLPWYAFAAAPLLSKRLFYFNELYGFEPIRLAFGALRAWGQASEGTAEAMSSAASAASWAAAAGYLGLAALGARAVHRRGWPGSWALAGAWVPGGLGAVLLLDWAFSYYPFPRQSLFALPFYLLFVARGAEEALDRIAGRSGAALALAALGAALAFPVHSEDLRALRAVRAAKLETVRKTRQETRAEETLLFSGPNNLQMFLLDYDRAAFLRAEHPRMRGGFYQFRLPDDLRAARPDGDQRLFSIVQPGATLEEERARWRALVGGPGSRTSLAYADTAKPLPGEERKLAEFSDFVKTFSK